MYNTTQLILVNGRGYKTFIEIFLKPFFISKIDNFQDEIRKLNDEILGLRTVKRSAVKYKKGVSFPCKQCDYACKNISTLNKHKISEHALSFNTSQKSVGPPRHSTRNNSVVENLMLEDLSTNDLPNETTNLEENGLKYTCMDCHFITISKTCMDNHVELLHPSDKNEEVKFECTECKHEFSQEDDYDSHIKSHDELTHDTKELETLVYLDILENLIDRKQSANKATAIQPVDLKGDREAKEELNIENEGAQLYNHVNEERKEIMDR